MTLKEIFQEAAALTEDRLKNHDIVLETVFSQNLESVKFNRHKLLLVFLNLFANSTEALD